MNGFYLAAGIVALLTTALHGVAGEYYILMRMKREVFPAVPNGRAQAKAEVRMVWHGMTAYFGVVGIMLLLLAFDQLGNAEALASLTALQFGALALVLGFLPPITIGRAIAAVRSPQWVLMVAIAGLTYAGTLV